METLKEELDFLKLSFKKKLISAKAERRTCVLVIDKSYLKDVALTLLTHKSLRYTQLIDVCAVDYLGSRPQRFEIVYHFLSMHYNRRLRLKVGLAEDETIPSLAELFHSAPWWERETYDMYGIVFDNHPDLRRLLNDYDFEGYPLRKDFPLMGYTQVRYDAEKQKVIKEPVYLKQAYRTFDTLSPFEGMGDAATQASPHTYREKS